MTAPGPGLVADDRRHDDARDDRPTELRPTDDRPMRSAPVLSVRDLSVDYVTARGRIHALDRVSFDLADGEAIALIGESGSGKTTLGMAVLRLLPGAARVVGGSIAFRVGAHVTDVLALSGRSLRAFRWRDAALVPQSSINALNPVLRVRDHFADTAAAHGHPGGDALARRGADVLSLVRLDPARVWRAYPHELSGGMRQRVLIALAMFLSPRVLVMDEPTTALDILTQRAVLDVLAGLRAATGVSVIFISHDLGVAAEVGDRVLTMYAGRLVEAGPTATVMAEPRHPYTIGLLQAVPSLTASTRVVRAIPGTPPDLAALPPGCAFAPRCALATDETRAVVPELREIGPDHLVACHRAEQSHVLLERGA